MRGGVPAPFFSDLTTGRDVTTLEFSMIPACYELLIADKVEAQHLGMMC